MNCFLKAADLIKPDSIYLNGDILDCGTFSRHDINKAPKTHWTDSEFYLASEKDYQACHKFFTSLNKIAPRADKEYLLGNHEVWLVDFIKQSPATRNKLFAIETRLPVANWHIRPHRQIRKIGKLRIVHALYTGNNHAKKHVDSMGKSILYGDSHDIQVHSKVTPEDESFMAWSCGCLCDMNPSYLKGRPNNWNHAFAIVYLFNNGDFQVDIKRIQGGKVVVDGRLIRG